jgi:hypothetical protein
LNVLFRIQNAEGTAKKTKKRTSLLVLLYEASPSVWLYNHRKINDDSELISYNS